MTSVLWENWSSLNWLSSHIYIRIISLSWRYKRGYWVRAVSPALLRSLIFHGGAGKTAESTCISTRMDTNPFIVFTDTFLCRITITAQRRPRDLCHRDIGTGGFNQTNAKCCKLQQPIRFQLTESRIWEDVSVRTIGGETVIQSWDLPQSPSWLQSTWKAVFSI